MAKNAIDPFITLETLTYYHGKSIAEIKALIKADTEISITDDSPTEENSKIWIKPTVSTTYSIPELNDDEKSTQDTWSSYKISTEIDSVLDNLEYANRDDIDSLFGEV